ncbi:MAG TPA: hypothetical protein VF738_08025, partial [Rhodanobacter sp.]
MLLAAAITLGPGFCIGAQAQHVPPAPRLGHAVRHPPDAVRKKRIQQACNRANCRPAKHAGSKLAKRASTRP